MTTKPFDYERILGPFNQLAAAYAALEAEHEVMVNAAKSLHWSVESVLGDPKFVRHLRSLLRSAQQADKAKTDELQRALASKRGRR